MQTVPLSAVTMSTEEKEIVLELLDRERTNLPVEIHHTRTAKFRDLLKHRLVVINQVFDRLSAAPPEA